MQVVNIVDELTVLGDKAHREARIHFSEHDDFAGIADRDIGDKLFEIVERIKAEGVQHGP